MSSFKTLGPAVHTTDEGYSVHPVLEVELGPPASSKIVTHVVVSPEGAVVHAGDRDDCVVAADEFEQVVEIGLP
jgi:hypothetical protein